MKRFLLFLVLFGNVAAPAAAMAHDVDAAIIDNYASSRLAYEPTPQPVTVSQIPQSSTKPTIPAPPSAPQPVEHSSSLPEVWMPDF